MNAWILQQPFDANGALRRFGDEVTRQLASGEYNEAQIFSAFVASSGTRRLSPALRSLVEAGGTVEALIGVNNGLTSLQAVDDLQAAGVTVSGLHTGGSVLYHPKVYFLRGQRNAWLSVGSSNLTGEGFYRNVETNSIVELDLTVPADQAICDATQRWAAGIRAVYRANIIALNRASFPRLVENGVLVDELSRARESRGRAGRGNARPPGTPPPLRVPALPAAIDPLHNVAARRAHPARRAELSVAAPTRETRQFAMILSAHDASKKTGTPGTPELSLPRACRDFFPRLEQGGRQFPDAYFVVRLNTGVTSSTVEYRIWERPGGLGVGHADLRINIKHDTVNLMTDGGGDIILFEATATPDAPAYDVWIIAATDPLYTSLAARCTHRVTAHGAGAQKRYGFF